MHDLDYLCYEFTMYEDVMHTGEFLEAGIYDALNAISIAFEKIVKTMQHFITNLSSDVATMMAKHEANLKLKTLKERLRKKDPTLPKMIEFPDIGKINKIYGESLSKFSKELNAIMKLQVEKDNDFQKFTAKCDKFNLELVRFEQVIDDLLENPVLMKHDEAIVYVEGILNKRNACYDRYFGLIKEFNHMKNDAVTRLSIKSLEGAALPAGTEYKKKGLLGQLSSTVSRVIRKIIRKLAFWIV